VSTRAAGPDDRPWRSFELAGGISAMFTSRSGGVSAAPYDLLNLSGAVGDDPDAVSRNRSLLGAACDRSTHPVTWMRQVHGSAVRQVASGSVAAAGLVPAPAPVPDPGPVPAPAPVPFPPGEADAQFTDVPGLPLGVLVADCAPVLLADAQARIVGAAHAGRAGLAAGVVPQLVSAMGRAGARPSRMHAVLGPMICGACYEVPAQLRDAVAKAAPGSGCVTRSGSPGIDIRAGLEAQLAGAGVPGVTGDRRCTAESPELYSYRRDGRTGRFAGVIWLAS
jgi:polyphenol oxidase